MKRRSSSMTTRTTSDMDEDVGAGTPANYMPLKKRRMSVGRGRGRRASLSRTQRMEVQRIAKSNIRRIQELKYLVSTATATAVPATFAITGAPWDIAQGDTDSTRDGDRLEWCGTMEMNLQIVNGLGATGDQYNNTRIIIAQWHPVSTATPTPTVLNFLANGPSGAPDIYSTYNHDTRQCYKILFDKVFTTFGNGNAATSPITDATSTGVHHVRIPFSKVQKQVQYSGGGAQATNRIFMIFGSDSVLATHPTIAYTTKIFWRDS